MHDTLKKVFIFTAGAAIGSLVTWKLLDRKLRIKYQQLAKEEIDSVVERFSNIKPSNDQSEPKQDTEQIEIEFSEEELKAEKEEYLNYSKMYGGEEKDATDFVTVNYDEEEDDEYEPYVISPEEFGKEGYELVDLTYYADKVLTDDWDNVIDDVEDLLGEGSLETVGQYEDDVVHVRNEGLKTDYEITFDPRDSTEVLRIMRPSTHDDD